MRLDKSWKDLDDNSRALAVRIMAAMVFAMAFGAAIALVCCAKFPPALLVAAVGWSMHALLQRCARWYERGLR